METPEQKSKALYILQMDCVRNGERLDVARELIDDIIYAAEAGDSILDFMPRIHKLKKLLQYTKAFNQK